MNKEKILMVCYYYPPLKDVGVKRSVAFSEYLSSYTPVVLTVSNPDRLYCSVGDPLLENTVEVHRARNMFNCTAIVGKLDAVIEKLCEFIFRKKKLKYRYAYNFLCIPDHFVFWVPAAFYNARKIIKKNKIKIIYISCTPHSAALIGVLLKLMYGDKVKLIVDYRDPFYISDFALMIPGFRRGINKWFQKLILEKSDRVIFTTNSILDVYIDEYPTYYKKYCVIQNGVDVKGVKVVSSPQKYSKFTLIYAGNFYLDSLSYDGLFAAISSLKKKGIIAEENFCFRFYGEEFKEIQCLAERNNLDDLVVARERVGFESIVNILQRSHAQLLRIYAPMLSTKLFEGIYLNTPFLAQTESLESIEIIRKYSPNSEIVGFDDSAEIEKGLYLLIIKQRQGGGSDNDISDFLCKFSREALTKKLESIIMSM